MKALALSLFLVATAAPHLTIAQTQGGNKDRPGMPQAIVADGEGYAGAYRASRTYTPPTDSAVLAKLDAWRDRKFGFFVHWGPYSQWGIDASWPMSPVKKSWNVVSGVRSNEDRDAFRKEYVKLPLTFNPVKFDPDRWAQIAADAGTRYFVFTTKHHDGFSMWDTKTTDYRITAPNVPYHANPNADIVKVLFDAFRKKSFMIGAYFSKPDWHTPTFWVPGQPVLTRHTTYDVKAHPELWARFKAFTHAQIDELVSGYGPVDILWLDGGWVRPDAAENEDIDMPAIAANARSKQPGLLVVDRTVGHGYEDYLTPEGTASMPQEYTTDIWEACTPLGQQSWGFNPDDTYRPVSEIVGYLVKATARNGALLLNVGPDGNGEIPPAAVERLHGIGAWLKVNGEAIYATRPLAPYERGNLFFTQKRGGERYAIWLSAKSNWESTPKKIRAKDAATDSTLPATLTIPADVAAGRGKVALLGSRQSLKVTKGAAGELVVAIPGSLRKKLPGEHAWTFKISR
ncbi:alpha-L-fucosidase [Lysobacter enzymogenes]|uniref:alpha-L-fucosidase n=1 Tax=Lysobacter enzymogenes TaxID=69 RepID=UPI001441CDB6|nr:alpha-L-fucosidase [Lysobacter enzymogenes]